MDVQHKYDRYRLKIHRCKLGKRYFDPFRNMFVHITPEETVRQKTCRFLCEELHVPRACIYVEEHLVHYGVTEKNGRMDIVITYTENGIEFPLAVVECKEGRVPVIAQQVKEQAEGYASCIGALYFILTNGVELYCYRYEEQTGMYEEAEGVLTYQDMLGDRYVLSNKTVEFTRFSYETYYNFYKAEKDARFCDVIGEDTEKMLIPAILNLSDCFLDVSHRLEELPSGKYTVLADLGRQYRRYGDASGGDFGSGNYRVIRLRDTKSREEFLIGFMITTTSKVIQDPKYGTADGKSVLVVMKNDGEHDETPLQINLNQCLLIHGDQAELTHNARITRKGKSKKGLLEYVKGKHRGLVQGNSIFLGRFHYKENLYIDCEEISDLLCHIIEYVIDRHEYKTL